MKTMIKWMCAIMVVMMGAFVITACGDDTDDPANVNAPSSSQILGTWEVVSSPVTNNGPTKGTLFYIASSGVVKMKMAGESTVYTGRYTYVQATGLFTPTFDGMGAGAAVLSMRSDGKISMLITDKRDSYTIIIEKKSSDDVIQGGTNGGGGGGQATIRTPEIIGTWVFLLDGGNYNNVTGVTVEFYEDGTGIYYKGNKKENITYTSEYDKKGRIYAKWTYAVNGEQAELKAVPVQNGNVLNGEGRMIQDGIDFAGVTMMRKGYVIPSEGILGRWEVTSVDFNGPSVGEVMVFGNDGELYVEGDYKTISYDWNTTTNRLIIHLQEDGDMPATVQANGWTTGSTATVTIDGGKGTLTLKKL